MNKTKNINWLIASLIFLVVMGIIICESNKAYWDHKVKELCDKDGGVTIYEKVVISKGDYPTMKFTSAGRPILPPESSATERNPFFYSHKKELIKENYFGLDVIRYEDLKIRSADKKVLSKKITYGRKGGDFPIGFEQSHITCDLDNNDLLEYGSVIIVKE